MSKPTEKIDPASASAEPLRYFNEYANGIGYLNSLRLLVADDKPERYAAQVTVIQGPADKVHYEYHDLIIASKLALGVVLQHREAIEAANATVLMRFTMINPRAKAFIFQHGDRSGELGTCIDGLLSRILSLKINGELVYQDQRLFDDQPETAHETQT